MTQAGVRPLPSPLPGAAAPLLPPGSDAPGDRLARFWALRGRRVFRSGGVWWGHHRGPFYASLPFQLRLDLGAGEIRGLLRSHAVPALAFPTDGPGLPGGHYVARTEGYGLASVARKQRLQVTRGLEACRIRPLDADELIRLGLPLNRDTLARQGREDATFLDPIRWAAFLRAVERVPGMAMHGAFVEGRLATWLISCQEGEWLHLLYKMSSTAEREHHPNHALDFTLIQEAREGIRFVGNGQASVLPNEGLDRYKRQLGYELRPHNLSLHFHPALAPFLGRTAAAILRRAAAGWPGNVWLAYAQRVMDGALASAAGTGQPRA